MATTGEPRIGGHILADTLVALGIRHAFAVPGESYLDVLDGLYGVQNRLHLVTCRFEAGAANMAEACGKLTGRPAAAFVTRGPGACHAAIGVHIAMQDSTPMLLFVGQIPFAETDRESFQEVDYRRMFAPLAKWVTQIDDAARIPELVAHAYDVATTGRPGPVVIALSEEMQKATATVADPVPTPLARRLPDPAALARMQAMLAASRRPLAILGGNWSEAARAALAAYLSARDVPVAVGFRRQSLYDGTQENYVGDLGVGSDPALVSRAREADLVLAFGTRLPEATTQGYTLFDTVGATPIVHVHPDPAEIGRVFRVTLGIPCDLDAFAASLADLPPVAPTWGAWTRELRALRIASYAVPDYPGSAERRAVPARAGGAAGAGCRDDLRCRQFRDLAGALHARARGAGVPRPDGGCDGLCGAGGGGRGDRESGAADGGLRRRRRVPDDRAGTGDRDASRRGADRAGVQQRACTARSACTRNAAIPAASSARR